MRTPLPLLMPLGLVLLSGSARAEDVLAVAKRHEAGFRKAMLSKDLSWFAQTASRSFAQSDAEGHRLDRAQAIAMVKQTFGMGTIQKIDADVLSAEGTKNGLRATVRTRMTLITAGKRPSTIRTDALYVETWSRHGGRWRMDSLHERRERTTVDGKPMKGPF